MRLAKQHLDIAMFTHRVDHHLRFWKKEAALRFDHSLDVRDGWRQHRFDANGSVIKVNDYEGGLTHPPPSGYTGLTIASREVRNAGYYTVHPDGGKVRVVPRGLDGVLGIGVTVSTPDPDRMMAFYVDAMQFPAVAPDVARCGDSLLFVEKGVGGVEAESFSALGLGYRYLTVQIYDADKETDGIIARGGRLASAPADYGKIARVSFVKDPDGNWIEISARASLTGVVPGSDQMSRSATPIT